MRGRQPVLARIKEIAQDAVQVEVHKPRPLVQEERAHAELSRTLFELTDRETRLSAILDRLAGRFAVRFVRCTELTGMLADG